MGIEWYRKDHHQNHSISELVGDGKRRKFPDKVYLINVGERSGRSGNSQRKFWWGHYL